MAESMLAEHPDLSSLTTSPGLGNSPIQKRKRESNSPGLNRIKRHAPAAHMSDTSFMDSALDAGQGSGVSVADFNALQQAAQGEHPEAPDPASATSTAQAALGMYPTLHVPPSTEEQFAAQAHSEPDHTHDTSFNDVPPPPDGLLDPPQVVPPQHQQTPPNGVQQHTVPRYSSSVSNPKPTVGSEEWHKMRKDNHKEVERRRRETINEGINELAKIVPGCEKNKGSILQRAVSFISQLKENEQQNIEKWTLEKLLTEQAITELSASNDKLKQECERLYRELETWKRVAQNAGLEPPQPKEENTAAPISS
ncbi:basic helix-loop-helix protein [Neonectria magnoliae]|uniref:Basic helix-loop-helix protein n=1 Tax=Neonectria magnoliae TaxID=2732573 RepID=A0ABR1I5R7_9HYPO